VLNDETKAAADTRRVPKHDQQSTGGHLVLLLLLLHDFEQNLNVEVLQGRVGRAAGKEVWLSHL
jgi:hypothetical protein